MAEAPVSYSSIIPIVALIFMRSGNQVGIVKALGVLMPEISETFGTNPTDVGVAFGVLASMSFCPGLGTSAVTIIAILELTCKAGGRFGFFLGLGLCGYPFGMIAAPMLAGFLQEIYGWRGALLILGAVMSHIIPNSLFVIPQKAPQSGSVVDGKTERERVRRASKPTSCIDRYSTAQTLQNNLKGQDRGTCNDQEGDCGNRVSDARHVDQRERREHMQARRGEGVGSHCKDLAADSAKELTPRKSKATGSPQRATVVLRSTLQVYSHLIVFIIAEFPYGMIHGGWRSFLVPRAMEIVNSVFHAASLSIIAAVFNLAGRMSVAVMSRRSSIEGLVDVFIIVTILNAIALVVDVMVFEYSAMTVTTMFESFSVSSRAVLSSVIIQQQCPAENYPMAFSVEVFTMGLGALVGTLLSGVLADRFKSFNVSFMLLAVIEGPILVLVVMSRLMMRWKGKK
ncbi:uncharacterized protein [Diadema setosum]|uniref:uncharacterized protein n=1 Tax=Diadema setosum TaxID=31175 RepID=UPI003B3B306E